MRMSDKAADELQRFDVPEGTKTAILQAFEQQSELLAIHTSLLSNGGISSQTATDSGSAVRRTAADIERLARGTKDAADAGADVHALAIDLQDLAGVYRAMAADLETWPRRES